MGLFSWLFGSKKLRKRAKTRDVKALVEALRLPAAHAVKTKKAARSHIGGVPRAPASFDWPKKDGRPLSFLAQLHLPDAAQAGGPPWLPKKGDLLFFYDAAGPKGEGGAWGFDPKDLGSWKVLHLPGNGNPDSKAAAPRELSPEYKWKESRVEFRPVSVPPCAEHPEVEALEFTEPEYDALDELHAAEFKDKPRHQLGGRPYPIQGDGMDEECQFASNGVYCGDPDGFKNPRTASLRPGAKDWRLLLQLDSDDDLDMMWGDGGMLYFWIREQDAREGAWDKAWMILQCC